jgi:hypothetical protein
MRSVLSRARPKHMVAYAALILGGFIAVSPGTASAGACAPVGDILKGWDNLGGASGPLGSCVNNEGNDGAGGKIEQFQFGWMDWITGEPVGFGVHGLIGTAWMSRYGGPAGTSQPSTNEEAVCDEWGHCGRMNVFAGHQGYKSFLVWNPPSDGAQPCSNSDNVCIVFGAIGRMWAEGGTTVLALPSGEEFDAGDGHIWQWFGSNSYIKWNKSSGVTCQFNLPPDDPSAGIILVNSTGSPC